jgi:hypothetical protein
MTPDIPPPQPAPVGRIETDFFCSACGYNLHALAVTLDSRLQIPIVRCTECGKFHAAGIATGAGRPWLSRLASILLFLWIAFLFAALAAWAFAHFIMDLIAINAFSKYQFPSVPGAPWSMVEVTPADFGGLANYLFARLVTLAFSAIAGYGLGFTPAVFISHIRRQWWLLLTTIPLAAAALALYLTAGPTGMTFLDPAWPFRTTAFQTLAQLLGLTLGIWTARPLARTTLRILLPRTLLQHLTFLWQIDHLQPPPPRPA